jgi:threonine dehydrogenase-like Zn-dependent dehydrogenase
MVVRDVPTPVVGSQDVLIRVLYAGVCGTPHIGMDSWRAGQAAAHHGEFAATERLGPEAEAETAKPGDLVTAEGHIIWPLPSLPDRQRHLCTRLPRRSGWRVRRLHSCRQQRHAAERRGPEIGATWTDQ